MAASKTYRLTIRHGVLSMTPAAFRLVSDKAVRSYAGSNLFNPRRDQLDAIMATLRKLAEREPHHFTPASLDQLGTLSHYVSLI